MNRSQKVNATERSKDILGHILERAKTLQTDTEKQERLKQQECVVCYYSQKVGGSAMTNSSCKNCEKEMLFASTYTDELCIECAIGESLCKHCGADIELKIRRNW
jgi:hypothetical protein